MSEIHDCGRMAGCSECPRDDEVTALPMTGAGVTSARYLCGSERIPPTYVLTATDTTPAIADADEREQHHRRERYAAAIAAAGDLGNPHEWYEWLDEADAAMAVADAEHSVQFRSYERANDDLHQEQSRLVDENARLRGAHMALIDSFDAMEYRYVESDRESASLRAELELASTTADSLARALAKNQMRVERVRANLRNGGCSDAALIRSIRGIVEDQS